MINHNRYCFIKKPIDRKQRRKMFAAQYCVTPTKRPGIRFPEKATSFLRDVKRRSLRVKRSKSLVINPPGEKRKSGKSPPNLWQESHWRFRPQTHVFILFITPCSQFLLCQAKVLSINFNFTLQAYLSVLLDGWKWVWIENWHIAWLLGSNLCENTYSYFFKMNGENFKP